MRYLPQRARKAIDLALLLKCCSHCLGDLEFRSDFSGEFYTCLQCNARAEPANKIGRLTRWASDDRTGLARPTLLPQ